MTALVNAVAVYGAIVASGVAVVQWIQWRESRNDISIVNATVFEFGRMAALETDNELHITNRSGLEIFVHNCWVGHSLRRWSSPWRREIAEATTMFAINGACLTGKPAGHFRLKPGKRAEIYFRRNQLNELEKPPLRWGFGRRKSVIIEHSASATPAVMFDI